MKRRSFIQSAMFGVGGVIEPQLAHAVGAHLSLDYDEGRGAAETPFPLPRQLRQTDVLTADGSDTYGPFAFKIFEGLDVSVFKRESDEQEFLPADVIITKVSEAHFDYFMVQFSPPLPSGWQYIVVGDRLQERKAGIARGMQVSNHALEMEISKIGVVLQEHHRELRRSAQFAYGAPVSRFPKSDGVSLIGWDGESLVNRPTDGASAALAQEAAEAALSAVPNVYPPSRTIMAAYNTAIQKNAFLTEHGHEGQFHWDPSNLTTEVAADPLEIGFVAPASDPTGSTGAWRRNLKLARIRPEDAGVFGDDVDRPENVLGMQRAIDFAAREGCVLSLARSGLYRLAGPMITRSGLFIEREPGAILRPTEWSQYAGGGGQFFGNVFATRNPNEMVQHNIRFDLEIDGSLLPTTTLAYAVAGSWNTVLLPAVFDDNIREGISYLTVVFGTGAGQIRKVQRWNPVTRVATITPAWRTPPNVTSFIGEGGNDNAVAFARGAFDIAGNIIAREFKATWVGGGVGGKAFNGEEGCRDFDVSVVAKRCGWGAFIEGAPGNFTGYSSKNVAAGNDRRWSRDIRLRVDAESCECALGVYGQAGNSDPDGSGNNALLIADVRARNCGHATSRPAVTSKNVKSSVVVLGEGNNARIDLYSVIDADFAPLWPMSGDPFVGAGLSGGVGAVIGGWGNEITIRATHVGEIDALYMLDNGRAVGEDAGPTGLPRHVFGLDVEIKHRGGGQPADGLFWQRSTGGKVQATEIAARLAADVDYWPTTVIGRDLAYRNVHIDVHARLAGNQAQRGVRGNASLVRANRNNLATADGFYSLDTERFRAGAAIGAGPDIKSVLVGTAILDFGTVDAGIETFATVLVPGVVPGITVWVNVSYDGARIPGVVVSGAVTAADTVTIYFFNATNAAKSPAARTWSVAVITV